MRFSDQYQHSPQEGFTLVEVLFYIAIFSMVLSFSIIAFYQVLSAESQNSIQLAVGNEASFSMQKISWGFSGAQSINQAVISTSSAMLSLNKYNFSSNPIVFQINPSGISMSRGIGPLVPLTSSRVRVSQFSIISQPPSGTIPASVQFSFSAIASATPSLVQTMTTMENTFYLRK